MSMWEPFSPDARESMVMAQEEAQRNGDAYVAPHHVLLGILRQSSAPAARVLIERGLTLDVARAQLEPSKAPAPMEEMVFTPSAKRSIELAFETAREYNHRHIGVEHLICGLVRAKDSPVMQIFAAAAIPVDSIQAAVMDTAR